MKGMVFYFTFSLASPILSENTQNRMQDSNNVKDANHGPSEPT
jgi:hypothetical protein